MVALSCNGFSYLPEALNKRSWSYITCTCSNSEECGGTYVAHCIAWLAEVTYNSASKLPQEPPKELFFSPMGLNIFAQLLKYKNVNWNPTLTTGSSQGPVPKVRRFHKICSADENTLRWRRLTERNCRNWRLKTWRHSKCIMFRNKDANIRLSLNSNLKPKFAWSANKNAAESLERIPVSALTPLLSNIISETQRMQSYRPPQYVQLM